MARILLKCTVLRGPDAGKTAVFDQPQVSIGRAWMNDLVLQDRFVSNQHGLFKRTEHDSYTYEDLQSRHGSLVIVHNRPAVSLHRRSTSKPIPLFSGGEIQIGSTVLRVQVERPQASAPSLQRSAKIPTPSNARFITAIHEPQPSLHRLSQHSRFELVVQLAGKLNGLTRLEDILDQVATTTFEAFPSADFFSIHTLQHPPTSSPSPQKPSLEQLMCRHRNPPRGTSAQDDEPLISLSLLEKVVQTQESHLFVRDDVNVDLSQSILDAKIQSSLCAPLVGQRSLLGVVQLDTRHGHIVFGRQDLDLFAIFASNIAFAIERARLTENIYAMFEGFVRASVHAIEARDPITAGHSERVTLYTIALAEAVNASQEGPFADVSFSDQELRELRYATLLHDFGKVGVREAVLMKYARVCDKTFAVIQHRFEAFKAAHLALQTTQAFNTSASSPDPKPALERVRAQHRAFCDDLDRILSRVDSLRVAARVSEDDLAFLHTVASRRVRDMYGERRSLLTRDEVYNLSIQRGTLNSEEFDQVRSHAGLSEEYLSLIPWSEDLQRIPSIAGAHHEKLDGSGYPRGLHAEDLPIQVRMMTIADIFDALTACDRPYRQAATMQSALDILWGEAREGKLDLDLMNIFASHVAPVYGPRSSSSSSLLRASK